MKISIKKEQAGKRLDLFLSGKTKKTRGEVQRLIAAGRVLVSGIAKSNHYALKEGEEVEITKSGVLGAGKGKKTDFNVKIVFENDEFLVLNKPAGLIVHGAPHIKEPTLADWLIKKYPALKKVGEDKSRPGIMHRLDKDVSGLLAVAKTNKAFLNLKKQFQKREVEKEYTALVYGAIAKEEDKIDFLLKRSAGGHRQAATPAGYNFKENFLELREAETTFRILKRFINYTLLSVKIKSGRKHQIRVHLFAYGYPLVGDNLYSTKVTRDLNRRNNLGRIFLVSSQLSFTDLKGQKQIFKIDLPSELVDFLAQVK
jgi:23S rRNA pseudouridine1911/1915/1917 synthase